jgi:hypothetical protein
MIVDIPEDWLPHSRTMSGPCRCILHSRPGDNGRPLRLSVRAQRFGVMQMRCAYHTDAIAERSEKDDQALPGSRFGQPMCRFYERACLTSINKPAGVTTREWPVKETSKHRTGIGGMRISHEHVIRWTSRANDVRDLKGRCG